MNQNKIRILPENLTNKIAAGEVVDRPASVVKELVENSIDAGATEITVILKDGGKGLIQVVDNGVGMSRDDLCLAFQRHATSKIYGEDDLETIRTLGFRGEALASIASVSRLEAKSVLQGETAGYLLRIEGGVMSELEASSGTVGTAIAVKHLFYNTPARRKFLRASSTEYRQILAVMNRFLLAFPEIAFTLVHEGELIYELKPEAWRDRMRSVLGEKVEKNLLEISDDGPVKIFGFVGNQDTFRKSRGDQYLFLNRRYFVNKSLHFAVVSAYGEILPRGYFPVYMVFLEIDPNFVDVNVHPAKLEVKFANEGLVFSAIRGAIKRSLTSTEVVPPLTPFARQNLSQSQVPPPSGSSLSFDWSGSQLSGSQATERITRPLDITSSGRTEIPPVAETHLEPRSKLFERTNVWQLHNKYIVSQIKTGMIIIDQHVAHERVLYEKALESFEKRKPTSQQLLFPQIVELSAEDYATLLEMIPFLENIGFLIKSFGKNTVVVEGVPSGIRISDDQKILMDILDEYKRGKGENSEIRENVAKSFACHSAIKAGEPLSLEAMNALIDQLFSTREPYFCPHGRPVIINIPLEELDRRFRRH